MATTTEVRARILAVLEKGIGSPVLDDEFDDLALAVFRHQFELNAAYRAYCAARGATPATVGSWRDVPAVPTDAFKAAPLVCGEPGGAAAVFRTSGTTAGRERRGTHYLLDTSLYRAALRAGFRAHLLPDGALLPMLALVPPAGELPDSSLSFMIDDVISGFGGHGSGHFVSEAGLALEPLLGALDGAQRSGDPVLLAGTSLAFVHLIEALRERGLRFRLPGGSRVMDTGGFKGQGRQVGRDEMLATLEEGLGIAPAWVVNEYGMTEMSSQLYDAVAGQGSDTAAARRHRGPPWLRTLAVDPETLQPLPPGELGILRHHDLANLDSVAALQTADLGRMHDDGIELLGRATGAEARGCSIAMDELLSALGEG
jgi:hypothetical protein